MNARPKRPLSILHTVYFYHPHTGGAELVVQNVSEGLVARGHQVTVCTTKLPQRDFREHNGVRIVEFDAGGSLLHGFSGSECQAYVDYLRAFDGDVVMHYAAQQWATDLAFPVVKETRGRRVNILAPCGYSALLDATTPREPRFAGYFDQVLPDVLPYFDACIYHSAHYKDYTYACNHGLRNSHVISNGVDEAEFSAPTGCDFRARYGLQKPLLGLCVANFYKDKGQERIVECIRRMGRQDFCMVFIGKEGGELDALKAQAQGLDIVFLTDIPRQHVVAAFQAADLFLFGSYIEAAPLVIIEANASKTPFVTTDCGNVREMRGGVVCEDRQLYVQANRLLDDAALRRRLAEEGFADWQAKRTLEKVIDGYEALYCRLAQRVKERAA